MRNSIVMLLSSGLLALLVGLSIPAAFAAQINQTTSCVGSSSCSSATVGTQLVKPAAGQRCGGPPCGGTWEWRPAGHCLKWSQRPPGDLFYVKSCLKWSNTTLQCVPNVC